MIKILRFTILFLLLFGLSACASSQAETNPAAVIEAGDAAWNSKDVDAILDLFADDAIAMNGRGTFYGKEELRGLIEGMLGEFTVDCGNYFVAGKEVTYDCLYVITDTGGLAGERFTAIVVDGKVKADIRTDRFDLPKEFTIDSSLP